MDITFALVPSGMTKFVLLQRIQAKELPME
jgi:hypothetical protein